MNPIPGNSGKSIKAEVSCVLSGDLVLLVTHDFIISFHVRCTNIPQYKYELFHIYFT